jgi:hypothetical protein
MSAFRWNKKRSAIALALAEGKTQREVSRECRVSDRHIRRLLRDTEFSAEVDRLSLIVDTASRAERLRIAKRAIRQKLNDDSTVETDKDLLDWLKFAQSETDGINLGLTDILNAYS